MSPHSVSFKHTQLGYKIQVASFEEHSQETGVGVAPLAPHLPWHLPPLLPSNTTDVLWIRKWGDVFFKVRCTLVNGYIISVVYVIQKLRKCLVLHKLFVAMHLYENKDFGKNAYDNTIPLLFMNLYQSCEVYSWSC